MAVGGLSCSCFSDLRDTTASKSDSVGETEQDSLHDTPQKPTSARIHSQPSAKNDDFEPDLLVLGFEELDLSAGALVVGSGTSREDAWTKAALAGLGDRGEAYEKVRIWHTLSSTENSNMVHS